MPHLWAIYLNNCFKILEWHSKPVVFLSWNTKRDVRPNVWAALFHTMKWQYSSIKDNKPYIPSYMMLCVRNRQKFNSLITDNFPLHCTSQVSFAVTYIQSKPSQSNDDEPMLFGNNVKPGVTHLNLPFFNWIKEFSLQILTVNLHSFLYIEHAKSMHLWVN